MMLTTTSRSKLDKFIKRVASEAEAKYPSRYQDLEDYIQIGQIALWRAEQLWQDRDDKNFVSYAYLAIGRAIRRAAIKSTCIVSAPYRAKVCAAEIRSRLCRGEDEDGVREACVKVKKWNNHNEWMALRGMFGQVFDIKPLFKLTDKSLCLYSAINDIMSIPSLTNEERKILLMLMQNLGEFNKSRVEIP